MVNDNWKIFIHFVTMIFWSCCRFLSKLTYSQFYLGINCLFKHHIYKVGIWCKIIWNNVIRKHSGDIFVLTNLLFYEHFYGQSMGREMVTWKLATCQKTVSVNYRHYIRPLFILQVLYMKPPSFGTLQHLYEMLSSSHYSVSSQLFT